MDKLKPDYYFPHFTNITVNWLKENNIRTILSDLDGTLAPHDKLGEKDFEDWLEELEKAEISLVIVSNNGKDRVSEFADKYKLIGYEKCGKPKTKKLEELLFQKGLEPSTTCFLGDQLFTDIWCGKNLGIKTILVKPIGDKHPWWIHLKRIPENVLLNKWGIKR